MSLITLPRLGKRQLDDPSACGIHMSRLYLALAELEERGLSLPRVAGMLETFYSHTGLSSNAFLDLGGEALLKRPALISPLAGWKGYPFTLCCRRDDQGFESSLERTVGYSSTCPC